MQDSNLRQSRGQGVLRYRDHEKATMNVTLSPLPCEAHAGFRIYTTEVITSGRSRKPAPREPRRREARLAFHLRQRQFQRLPY